MPRAVGEVIIRETFFSPGARDVAKKADLVQAPEVRAAKWLADSLPTPAALIDPDGRVYYNRLAEQLLEIERPGTRSVLERHIAVIVAGLRDDATTPTAIPGRLSHRVRTATRRFLLEIIRSPCDVPLLGLIRLHTSRAPLMPGELRTRFGLTAREAEVAHRIASGARTKAIAASLGLSPHTVRRHTENVFRKVGVESRAGLAARLHAVPSADD